MTPADPSLLAQLRQLPSPVDTVDVDDRRRVEYMRCKWCKERWTRKFRKSADDEHPANGCLWYVAHAAILEAQPSETAPTPLRSLPRDMFMDVYVPGVWSCPKCSFELVRTALYVATGEAGVSNDMAFESEPCPNDGTPLVPVTWHERAESNRKWGTDLMEEIIAATGAEHLPGALAIVKAKCASAQAPVSAEADIIADQEARLDAAYLCGDRLPIANAATQEVTYAVCVLDKGHGGADHVSAAGIHRWPQRQPPAETPPQLAEFCQSEGPRGETICMLPLGHDGTCGWERLAPRPADTPPGLAPLPDVVCEHGTAMDVHCCNCHSGFLFDVQTCVCTFESPGPDFVELLNASKAHVRASVLWKRFIEHTPLENDIAVWMADFAIDAQRQASASVRREAIEAVKAVIEGVRDRLVTGVPVSENVARWVAGVESALNSVVRVIDEREAARVSPRPPSGGETP